MTQVGSLPSFVVPPVSEVVLGVQFDTVPEFLSPHLGLAWQKFRAEYPRVEEHPPLSPTFELFGSGLTAGGLQFNLPFGSPRVFFIGESGNRLYQLQQDRFLHNWRRIADADVYPRYEALREAFVSGFHKLSETLDEAKLGSIVPNQCEIAYINHLPYGSVDQGHEIVSGLFDGVGDKLRLPRAGRLEDSRIAARYEILTEGGQPQGRLTVAVDPARSVTGERALQLSLTVRGRPSAPSLEGVMEFLDMGRGLIVRNFADLTASDMHAMWGRTQ